MDIVQSILTQNPCYKTGRTISVKGLMLHSIGCPQPVAHKIFDSWNSASHTNSCVHAFIDGLDGKVYQTLPWNHRAWHCGSGSVGSANSTHIGVEMAEPDCISYTGGATFTCSDKARATEIAERTYKVAVELFAHLCKEFNLDPLADGVIISHAEGHSRGIASNHGDPEHLWNQLGTGRTMNGFRKDVASVMGKEIPVTASTQPAPVSQPTTTSSSSTKNSSFPKLPFQVRVKIDDLNMREEPNNSGKSHGYTGKGAFTITELSGSWGKLKAPKLWIYLGTASYCDILDTVKEDNSSESKPATTATSTPAKTNSSKPSYTVGKTYKLQTELKVRSGPGTNYAAKTHNQLTADGRKHDVDKDGALDAGTVVTCQKVANDGDDIWIEAPSGWLAAYYQGHLYIK